MSRWTDALLEPMRAVGDPPADVLIRSLHSSQGADALNTTLRTLVRNDELVPAAFPPEVRAYLEATAVRVSEADLPAVRVAERLFSTHGATVLMLLGFAALPQTYAAAKGAQVLTFTQRLTRDTRRRLLETFQFVLNVMREGGTGPTGRGLRDAQKIRLMHAAVRHSISKSPDYDATIGVPVNQEDQAGTLCAFSVVILDGMRQIGLRVTDEEEAAYVHTWNIVGRAMGVREELLARDPADSRALWKAIKRRQFGPSQAGRDLARALVSFYEDYMPGEALRGLPATQIRWFAGDDTADLLGLPPSDATKLVLWLGDFVNVGAHEVLTRDAALSRLAGFLGPRLLDELDGAGRGKDRPLFDIPPPLRNAWQLPAQRAPRLDEIDRAIAAAQARMTEALRPDGTYVDPNVGGPQFTAMTILAEHHLGLLGATWSAEAARWLRSTQLPDGSWGGYPTATAGDVGATSLGWAALLATGVPGTDPGLQRAAAWMRLNGGPAQADPMSQIFLAIGGHLRPDQVAGPPILALLAPGFDRLLTRRTQAFYTVFAVVVPTILTALRAEQGTPPGFLTRAALRKARGLLRRWQDPSGSWLGVYPVTMLGFVALRMLGVPLSDDAIARARARIDLWKVQTSEGSFVEPFKSEIWDTAMCTRVLVESGVPKEDPRVTSGIRFLLSQQGTLADPWGGSRRPGAPSTGGWPFSRDNAYGLDTDSTAEVLATLGTAADTASPEIRDAIDRGRAWLLGMQNEDGGWGAFAWGHATKPPGPFGQEPMSPPTGALGTVRMMLDPPPELGDGSSEEIAARALFGLARIGHRGPEIAAATAWLEAQQWMGAAWWGRWTVNFTAATGYALSGLMAAGVDPATPWVAAALDWLEARQNPDGGWGEGLDTYTAPERAGIGPSTPTQTGLVLTALVDAGRARDQAALHGLRWLLEHQEGGTWRDPIPMTVLVPPNQFYAQELMPLYNGLQALARWKRAATQVR